MCDTAAAAVRADVAAVSLARPDAAIFDLFPGKDVRVLCHERGDTTSERVTIVVIPKHRTKQSLEPMAHVCHGEVVAIGFEKNWVGGIKVRAFGSHTIQ